MMPVSTMAPAASSPATEGGTMPVASSTTMPMRMMIACVAPGPSGTACRRTRSGESTTTTSGSLRWVSSAFHVPWSSRLSPAWSVTLPRSRTSGSGTIVSPERWMASTIRSPLSVTMPGKAVWPISPDRGAISTSARPERALNRAASPAPSAASSRKARCTRAAKSAAGCGSPRTRSTSPSAMLCRRSGWPLSLSCTAISSRSGKSARSRSTRGMPT